MKKQSQTSYYVLMALVIAMVVIGWLGVTFQRATLIDASTTAFQQAALEIVQGLGIAARNYVDLQLNVRGRPLSDLPQIAQEAQSELFSTVRLLVDDGDPWIIGADNTMAFDESANFPYFGIPIDQFLAQQAAQPNGARSYESMLNDVMSRTEGVGAYIWENDNVEIGAWTPVMINDDTATEWMIGLTTPLSVVLERSGVNNAVLTSFVIMSIVTLVVIGVVAGLNTSLERVRKLEAQVQQLQIQIDTSKRDREVSEIVESDYFQHLTARAKELRARAGRAT